VLDWMLAAVLSIHCCALAWIYGLLPVESTSRLFAWKTSPTVVDLKRNSALLDHRQWLMKFRPIVAYKYQ
jgi:hypothetical protein